MIGLKYLLELMKNYKGCCLTVKTKALKNELKYAWQRAYRGYDDLMAWNIDDGFLQLYGEILKNYRNNLHSYLCDINSEEWNKVLDEMIELLDRMDIDKCDIIQGYHKEVHNEIINNKDRFFELFSKYFYDLWN